MVPSGQTFGAGPVHFAAADRLRWVIVSSSKSTRSSKVSE